VSESLTQGKTEAHAEAQGENMINHEGTKDTKKKFIFKPSIPSFVLFVPSWFTLALLCVPSASA
jgi:hypothetical protein